MIPMDLKKLEHIAETTTSPGDHSPCKHEADWKYLHMCVDDHSRLAYTKLRADKEATTSFLTRAADWLERQRRDDQPNDDRQQQRLQISPFPDHLP